MDYEKKYNDLVNDLKELWNCHTNDSQLLGELAEICPELAESEDERIRKAIIHYILYETKGNISEATEHVWVTWLEKQKEQKPAEPSDEELQRYQGELYDFKVFAARQAREHHISFVHDFEWNNFCAELLSYFNEKQKPAEWSKQSIIDALTKWLTGKIAPLHKKSLDGTITEREEMFMAALLEIRSLVNSPDFQIGKDTSAEWSEEDEEPLSIF